MFATHYLEKNNNSACIKKPPHPKTGMIIVIPCLCEPDVINTLESIYSCDTPFCNVEIILLINHSLKASDEVKNINQRSKYNILQWILRNNRHNLDFFVVGPVEFAPKWAGAGLARKKGMDEAVRRFNLLERPEGIIVSLDADTTVEKNYLKTIEYHFEQNTAEVGATIAVRHQTGGLSDKHLEGIRLYEKYMGYYKNALSFTGYPYPMFTVGSAFAVRAGAYVRRGGMNRRKAGEDFYFLQNLVHIGKVGKINNTTVHPSARLSDRVPFGTGPVLKKWMNDEKDLNQTYNFRAFENLRVFFTVKDHLFKISNEKYQIFLEELPEPIAKFLKEDNFLIKINDLNSNCSKLSTFQSRFFHKFNTFKILKFLNYAHKYFYQEADLYEQINLLSRKRISS
jgi:hypothetical protein